MDDQLHLLREEQHKRYLRHLADIENNETSQKTNDFMSKLAFKYRHIFNTDRRNKAAYIIQRFVKNILFEPVCINQNEISDIHPLYRFRVNITNDHYHGYSEENVSLKELNKHRELYQTHYATIDQKVIFFRYCFDIRKLYPQRNQVIEIYGEYYFMQPHDHVRIVRHWNKVNGETPQSIIYLTNFEYFKSLGADHREETKMPSDQQETESEDQLVRRIVQKYISQVSEISFL